jgi:hypothetical protein
LDAFLAYAYSLPIKHLSHLCIEKGHREQFQIQFAALGCDFDE